MLRMVTLWVLAGCATPQTARHVVQDKGSDTMVNLMARLSEAYLQVNPGSVVAVTGGGSGTGIKSLIDGTTDLANASREIKPEERERALSNGVSPVRTIIAYDGLAIYVSEQNPIAHISFEDLTCIYAADGTCNRWSDVGVTLDCGGTDAIIKLGRQNNSGTYEYFREHILKHGRFTTTMDQSGTQQVIDVLRTTPCAIGYGGMGYSGPGTRYVCLSVAKGEPCAEPTLQAVQANRYQFARPLQVYTNGPPKGPTKAFIDYVLSEPGQALVMNAGFVPVRGMNSE